MIGQAKRLVELNKLYNMQPEMKFKCPLISVVSGKGGTGKSIFSLNTALALSGIGKKVLLIDMDKNLSNIHIMLNENPAETMYDLLTHKSLIDNVIVNYKKNIDFLFGDSGKTDHPELNNRNLENLFSQISKVSGKYDFILIDTASGIGEEIKFTIKKSSSVIIVTNPEPTSIMDSYVVLKEMKSLNYGRQKFAVINKSPDYETGLEAFQNLKKAVTHFLDGNVSLLGIISNSQEISKSVMKQIPVMLEEQPTESTKEINKLAKKIINNHQMENNNH